MDDTSREYAFQLDRQDPLAAYRDQTVIADHEPTLQAGMEATRKKSMVIPDYASLLADELLVPLGFALLTHPRRCAFQPHTSGPT